MARLALRAIASPSWKWMPGMMASGRILNYSPAGSEVIKGNFIVTSVENGMPRTDWGSGNILDAAPVLDHPATKGCLLHIVREVFNEVPATTSRAYGWCSVERRDRFRWICTYAKNGRFHQAHGDSEEEVLVNALEAAENL